MRFNDLTGKTFGRWAVLSYAGERYWTCRCSCGVEKRVHGSNLAAAKSLSCGCLSVELTRNTFTKHGMARTPEHRAWSGMKDRCLNPNSDAYDRYGGRGISVFDGWIDDFAAFLAHVGSRPDAGYSLDRIKVNDGYKPGNVRWATAVEQNRNRRNVGAVGDTDTVTVRLENGVSNSTYHRRIREGWTREEAASISPRPKRANGLGRIRNLPAGRDANPGAGDYHRVFQKDGDALPKPPTLVDKG